MEIIVQKYGGTSVTTEMSRSLIAEKAIAIKKAGKSPVIVVSAMGRKGDPYATDTLIGLLNDSTLDDSTREMDMLMSCGEVISAVVLANKIKTLGYKAVALNGHQAGIFTDSNYGDASVVKVNPSNIERYLESDNIVIVTGFQGIDFEGNTTTLGRGGSDNTAAILGEALNAEAIEIYTDVDGIMTADPRVVKDANIIDKISYDEIYQMAVYGAKVVDHKAVSVARRSGKILKIKNTYSDAAGTEIRGDVQGSKTQPLRAITSADDVVQFDIQLTESDHGEKLLNALDKNLVEIDLINFFDKRKMFTVQRKDETKVVEILKAIDLQYETIDNCSKVTVVGNHIAGTSIMKRIIMALAKEQIEIIQTADSNRSISCLINVKYAKDAINILHKEFQL